MIAGGGEQYTGSNLFNDRWGIPDGKGNIIEVPTVLQFLGYTGFKDEEGGDVFFASTGLSTPHGFEFIPKGKGKSNGPEWKVHIQRTRDLPEELLHEVQILQGVLAHRRLLTLRATNTTTNGHSGVV